MSSTEESFASDRLLIAMHAYAQRRTALLWSCAAFRVVQETFFATLHTFYRFAHFGSSHNKMHVRADSRDGIQSDWKLWNDLDTLDKNKIGVKIKCATWTTKAFYNAMCALCGVCWSECLISAISHKESTGLTCSAPQRAALAQYSPCPTSTANEILAILYINAHYNHNDDEWSNLRTYIVLFIVVDFMLFSIQVVCGVPRDVYGLVGCCLSFASVRFYDVCDTNLICFVSWMKKNAK